MTDNAGALCIINGRLESADLLGQIDIPSENVIYEVIRIIEGAPLFLEDHYKRMNESMQMMNKQLMVSEKEIVQYVKTLAEESETLNFNVKIIVYNIGDIQNVLLYISKSYYPDINIIKQGVKVSLLYCERQNPNAKVINQEYKDKVSKKIEEDKVFEVLLVNKSSCITEGSKSNVFFIKQGRVYTAPGELVLKGITRKYIFEACKMAGLEVVEQLIAADELKDIEAAFLSGTSIKVLPIASIDGYNYDSSNNPRVTAIRYEYDKLIDRYIIERICIYSINI